MFRARVGDLLAQRWKSVELVHSSGGNWQAARHLGITPDAELMTTSMSEREYASNDGGGYVAVGAQRASDPVVVDAMPPEGDVENDRFGHASAFEVTPPHATSLATEFDDCADVGRAVEPTERA